jgi:para-nitrobenzyl esterase
VAHADDIAFVFRTLDADIETVSDRDREVSRIVSAYWVQFATSGDPNGPGLVTWPAYTEQTPRVLELGDELLVHDDLLSERMDFHIQRGTSLLDRAGR